MASNLWTSDRRLYLNADGAVVEADDPSRVSLLVAAGGTIPLADAERLGIITVTHEVKAAAPKVNKSKAAPTNKSG